MELTCYSNKEGCWSLLRRVAFCGKKVIKNELCFYFMLHANTTSSKYLFKGFNTFVFGVKRSKMLAQRQTK